MTKIIEQAARRARRRRFDRDGMVGTIGRPTAFPPGGYGVVTARLASPLGGRTESGITLFGDVRIVPDVPRAFAALVAERAPRSIALCGNVLARDCYTALRDVAVEWGAVEVYFGDERYVPVDHPDSNEGQARRVLLDHVSPSAIHGMHTADDVENAARRYESLVRERGPIDLIHLGVGPDGHTASLFPGTAAVAEQVRFVVANEDGLHDHPRVTLTFPAIASARLVVVTVSGIEKEDVVRRLRAGEDLPAARIRAREVVWLLDPEADGSSRE